MPEQIKDSFSNEADKQPGIRDAGLDIAAVAAKDFIRTRTNGIEVIHEGQSDIILNHSSPLSSQWGERIHHILQQHDFSSWRVIGGGTKNVMSGEIDEKRFVVKFRNKRMAAGDAQLTPAEWGTVFGPPRKTVYAEESILNEIILASKIKMALSTDEVQRKIVHKGYTGISLIEPIAGMVCRTPDTNLPYYTYLTQTLEGPAPLSEKLLVYEYIEGNMPNRGEGEALKEIIGEALVRAGIDIEYGDLRPDHFLIDEAGQVHVFDTEALTSQK